MKISAAADAGTLLSSDMLPLARSGDTNAYHATMAEVATFTNVSVSSGAYGNVGRNLLHNGLFAVQQRGAGPWLAGAYTADRWLVAAANDTINVTFIALADVDRTAIGDETAQAAWQNVFTGSATAGSYNFLTQRIENVRRLSGKTVTVSFWAKASVGTPALQVQLNQFFGTGGSPSAQVNTVMGNTPALTTTWIRYTLTAAAPTVAGKTFGTAGGDYTGLVIVFSAQTGFAVQSGTVQLWGVQLEIGSVATPLEKLDPADDLRRCQRFYQLQYPFLEGYTSAAGQAIGYSIALPPSMRAAPSTTVISSSNFNLGSPTYYTNGIYWSCTANSSAAGPVAFNQTVGLSADL